MSPQSSWTHVPQCNVIIIWFCLHASILQVSHSGGGGGRVYCPSDGGPILCSPSMQLTRPQDIARAHYSSCPHPPLPQWTGLLSEHCILPLRAYCLIHSRIKRETARSLYYAVIRGSASKYLAMRLDSETFISSTGMHQEAGSLPSAPTPSHTASKYGACFKDIHHVTLPQLSLWPAL